MLTLFIHRDDMRSALVEKGIVAKDGAKLRHFQCTCNPSNASLANSQLQDDLDDAYAIARQRTVERN